MRDKCESRMRTYEVHNQIKSCDNNIVQIESSGDRRQTVNDNREESRAP